MAIVLGKKKKSHFGDKHSIPLSSTRGVDTAGIKTLRIKSIKELNIHKLDFDTYQMEPSFDISEFLRGDADKKSSS